jgi:hypothetical protein
MLVSGFKVCVCVREVLREYVALDSLLSACLIALVYDFLSV